MRRRLILVLVLVPAVAAPASAGILFGRKKKPTPAEHVPQLIATLKTDKDEGKRAGAASDLRDYDPAQFGDIVPALLDALQNDKKAGVRAEAAQTLGKLRPVSQPVGLALEHALAKDPSMRVRLQARSSLMQYHWAGYRPAKKGEPLPPLNTKEPPLADPAGTFPPPISTTPTPAPAPRLKPQPAPPAPGARPLPAGPPSTAEPPRAPEPPAAPPKEEKGPDLGL